VKELALSLFQGKKIHPSYSADIEKLFQSTRLRDLFIRELGDRCAEKQPFDQKLEDPQFTLLCSILRKILPDMRRNYDGRAMSQAVPIFGYFSKAQSVVYDAPYYLHVRFL